MRETWHYGVIQLEGPSLNQEADNEDFHDLHYLCLDLHLQDGAHDGQQVADDNEQVPAIQELALVLIAEFAIVVLLEESGEPLPMTWKIMSESM